jgi:adenine-specific DNA methylase
LTQASHEALGGEPGTRPLVVDPFAGGGAIPLEALRVGADAFASDLNPVAVLLNKVVIELVPKFGERLAMEIDRWGKWIKDQAQQELGPYFPPNSDGSVPIAYLWARTIECEGPACGIKVPVMRSMWLEEKGRKRTALRMSHNVEMNRIDFDVILEPEATSVQPGTVKNGAVTCPVCGFTTNNENVRQQLARRIGGTTDARLVAVVSTHPDRQGRTYRVAQEEDLQAIDSANKHLKKVNRLGCGDLSPIPD